MQRKVRLKEVAARAGVAVNTASTILNRRPNSWASKATEARVFQAAKDLGYRPSRTARALQSGRFQALGLLIQDLLNPFFATLADELETAVEEHGLDLLVESCRSSLAREQHLFANLNTMEVDGAVVWLSDNETYRAGLGELFAAGLPVVALGNGIPASPFPVDAVLSDFTQGLTEAVDALCALGHRRFAFLSALATGQNDGGRPRLFRELLVARGIAAHDIAELRCDHSMAGARAAFAAFLQQNPDRHPTALVAVNDLSAIGAMRAARDAGLEVPRDISIVGVDDVPISACLPVALSSIRQRYRKITRAATELLLSRIEHPDDPALTRPRQVVLPTLFVRRESVGISPSP